MKSFLLLLIILLFQSELFAQDKTIMALKAGTTTNEVLGFTDIFYYPEFTKGRVVFKGGAKSEGRLNYNLLIDEMHFINKNGDTLALANEETIEYISIGKDTFYFNPGFLRVVTSNNVIKLCQKQIWRINQVGKIGAYGLASPAASITSFTSVVIGASSFDLMVNEDFELRKVNEYYFGDRFNHFVPADKKNLLNLFPKKETQINSYLKENKVDFANGADLLRLHKFLENLN